MVTTVKLNQIRVTHDWNREDVGDISSLVTSIRENGQLQPLLVWQDSSKKHKQPVYYLIDGRRRFAALQMLKKDPLVVMSSAQDSASAFLQSMAANLVREGNTVYEISRSFDQLVTEYGVLYDDIVKTCGKTAGYVSQHVTAIRVARRDPQLLEMFKAGGTSLYVFRSLCKLDEHADRPQFKRMVKLLAGGATSAEVGLQVDQYLKKKEQRLQNTAKRTGVKLPPKTGKVAADAIRRKSLTDYHSTEVRKTIKKLSVADLIKKASQYQDKFIAAKSVNMQRYYQGCIAAIECALGIAE
jgi:ParB/RepB/Spo0J family partition protein